MNRLITFVDSFRLDRLTQEVSVSHSAAWDGTSLVGLCTCFYQFLVVLSVCVSTTMLGAFLQDSLSRLGQRPLFISATGADSNSDAVLNNCKHMVCGINSRLLIIRLKFMLHKHAKIHLKSFYKNTSAVARLEDQSTATYCAVFTKSGELSLGLGDMDVHHQITEQYVSTTDRNALAARLVQALFFSIQYS